MTEAILEQIITMVVIIYVLNLSAILVVWMGWYEKYLKSFNKVFLIGLLVVTVVMYNLDRMIIDLSKVYPGTEMTVSLGIIMSLWTLRGFSLGFFEFKDAIDMRNYGLTMSIIMTVFGIVRLM